MDLAVHPLYQGRGLAKMLVKYGTDLADKEGLKCGLAGTAMGVPLYKKCGFVKVDHLELPMEPYGGGGTHVHGKSSPSFLRWLRLTLICCRVYDQRTAIYALRVKAYEVSQMLVIDSRDFLLQFRLRMVWNEYQL